MDKIIQYPYTPKSIAEDGNISGLIFSIPLYQRLFEWDKEQIVQLLDDLYSSMRRDRKAPYYIGMLTAQDSGSHKELVDGQQRFTAMMLLGIHFNWKDFLLASDNGEKRSRLQFPARPVDQEYLNGRIMGVETTAKNEKMEQGLKMIAAHIQNKLGLVGSEETMFGDFIYEHLTFFVSNLPNEYNSRDLNTYFERMNTSGKSLESFEILKVDMLRNLDSEKEEYTKAWNSVSIMEKKMLRIHNGESLDSLRRRYYLAITGIVRAGSVKNAFEESGAKFDPDFEDMDSDVDETNIEPKRILDIEPTPENPFKIVKRRTDEHAPLTFQEFLLQVLYVCIGRDLSEKEERGEVIPGKNITDFFDVRQLGKTFDWAFKYRSLDARRFLNKLVLFRLLMDYFIIRVDDEDEEPYKFLLYKADEQEKNCVKKYLSMLYSASSAMTYYEWIPDLLCYLQSYVEKNDSLELCGAEYLTQLKIIDDSWHKEEEITEKSMTYETIDRYWFWRIDYYLWEQRNVFFHNEDLKKIVEKYNFRRNRSIEHIAPQHPKNEFGDNNKFRWDDEKHPEFAAKRDCIGNMVMISSGQNSDLSNSCFEVKRVCVDRYIRGTGVIESLKMVYVYSKYTEWSLLNIDEHQRFSIDFLKASYNRTAEKWRSISERK